MKKITDEEYNTLRNEMIVRIQLMNTHNVSMITVVNAIWALAGVLFGSILDYQKEIAVDYIVVITIFVAILMLSPVFVIMPLAVKSGDNLGQIASIAGYLKVYAELPTLINHEDKFAGWEILQVKELNKKFHQSFFNSEYLMLSIFSLILSVGVVAIGCTIYFSALQAFMAYILIIMAVFLAVGILFTIITAKSSLSSSMLKSLREKTEVYLDKLSIVEQREISMDEKEKYRRILNANFKD